VQWFVTSVEIPPAEDHVIAVIAFGMGGLQDPRKGQNLLMAGDDLLNATTGTAVAQRSEAGQGILGAKEGKGMWV
jgi:hypothetical protein